MMKEFTKSKRAAPSYSLSAAQKYKDNDFKVKVSQRL